jgi:tetratricopeptide (TPR) repeat protein
LVLASERARWPEAEAAFRTAVAGGFDAARNDLGILLLESGRQAEGENELAEAGRRGQSNGWFNLGYYLWNQPERREEAVGRLRLAANAGYPEAYGALAYSLEELGRLDEALAAFILGVDAGTPNLEPHLIDFLSRHPELSEDGPESVKGTD